MNKLQGQKYNVNQCFSHYTFSEYIHLYWEEEGALIVLKLKTLLNLGPNCVMNMPANKAVAFTVG